jgi:hypothetical protein
MLRQKRRVLRADLADCFRAAGVRILAEEGNPLALSRRLSIGTDEHQPLIHEPGVPSTKQSCHKKGKSFDLNLISMLNPSNRP